MLCFQNEYKKNVYDFIQKNRLSVSLYEGVFTRVAKALLKKSDTVVDGGANHGFHTQHFLDSCGSAGKVFAVEAIPALSEKLDKLFSHYPAYRKTNKALYHITGDTVTFHWVKSEDVSSAIHLRDFTPPPPKSPYYR